MARGRRWALPMAVPGAHEGGTAGLWRSPRSWCGTCCHSSSVLAPSVADDEFRIKCPYSLNHRRMSAGGRVVVMRRHAGTGFMFGGWKGFGLGIAASLLIDAVAPELSKSVAPATRSALKFLFRVSDQVARSTARTSSSAVPRPRTRRVRPRPRRPSRAATTDPSCRRYRGSQAPSPDCTFPRR